MKGLLIKDFYMMRQYCKNFLLIAFVFLATSVFDITNVFFLVYPCLFAGMVPVTLYAYDEREKWCVYSATLPYTEGQIVSAKYLMSLLLTAVMTVLVVATSAVRMALVGPVVYEELFNVLAISVAMGIFTPMMILPFFYKFGAEKGRIAYFVVIAVLCAGGASLQVLKGEIAVSVNSLGTDVLHGALFGGLLLVALYALSWGLSISFYKKRQW